MTRGALGLLSAFFFGLATMLCVWWFG